MDKPATRGHFLRDLIGLVLLIGSAIQLIGNFDALVQLSQFAKWLVEHWTEFIELPLRQLLLQWGLQVPRNFISLLIIAIFPSAVIISVAIQFWRTLPTSTGEPKIDMNNALKGIPHRRLRIVLGTVFCLVLISVVLALITAHETKRWRSITDAHIFSCFFEKNERVCRETLLTTDMSQIPQQLDRLDASDREFFIKTFRQELREHPVYYILMSDGMQIGLLVFFALSAAYFYFYRYWVAWLVTLGEVSAYASYPIFHHRLVTGLSILSVIGIAFARMILASFAILGLSLAADFLPNLVQRLQGLL
jgi:hypothetical protein